MLQYVVPLELAGFRGIARLFAGLTPSSDLGGGEVRGPSLLAASAGTAGTVVVEAGKERAALGMQKPLQGGRKTVPSLSVGCTWCKGVETRVSENETHLDAGGPPRWRAVVSLAVVLVLGCRPWCSGLPSLASASMQGPWRRTVYGPS